MTDKQPNRPRRVSLQNGRSGRSPLWWSWAAGAKPEGTPWAGDFTKAAVKILDAGRRPEQRSAWLLEFIQSRDLARLDDDGVRELQTEVAEAIDSPRRIVLDMDSTEVRVHGRQEQSAYNGHFESTCYHPLLLFNREGDCLAAKLRPGNVHNIGHDKAHAGEQFLAMELDLRHHPPGHRPTCCLIEKTFESKHRLLAWPSPLAASTTP